MLEGKQQTAVPAVLVQALDTIGAGDMFAGAFLYAVTQGDSHSRVAWLANQAASQVVSKYGNRLTLELLGRIKSQSEERWLVDGARSDVH